MKTLTAIVLFIWLSALALPSSSGAAPSSPRFTVRVSYTIFVPRYIMNYAVTSEEILGTYQDDFGGKLREVFRSKLTGDQASRLYALLRTIPFDSLAAEYRDTSVDDGFELKFEIQVDQQPTKTITLANQTQPTMLTLCQELNLILPTKYAIDVCGVAKKSGD